MKTLVFFYCIHINTLAFNYHRKNHADFLIYQLICII